MKTEHKAISEEQREAEKQRQFDLKQQNVKRSIRADDAPMLLFLMSNYNVSVVTFYSSNVVIKILSIVAISARVAGLAGSKIPLPLPLISLFAVAQVRASTA